jgi:hypothetical protein
MNNFAQVSFLKRSQGAATKRNALAARVAAYDFETDLLDKAFRFVVRHFIKEALPQDIRRRVERDYDSNEADVRRWIERFSGKG